MAETTPGRLQQRISPRVKSKLIGWLRMVQKEQRDNGDKRIQNNCCEDFESLFTKVHDLCHSLEEFMRAIRPIGSSSGLISTARELEKDVLSVVKEFGSNAAEIWREFSLGVGSNELPTILQGVSSENSATTELPQAMFGLWKRLKKFIRGLWEIPEFSDKRLTDALVEFRGWLRYRAECIESRRDFRLVRPSTTRQYIFQVMKEMTQYVSGVQAVLSDFLKEGVSAIRDAQERSQTMLQNMSAVATFLSAVTATTLGYSMKQERLRTLVMGLWISSLILSIASAIDSQIVIQWRAAMYRSPRSTLPFWASFLFDYVPMGCLVIAVVAFSVGLVVWTIAADLATPVKISATVITCATFLVLFAIVIWEGRERWREQNAEPSLVDMTAIADEWDAAHQRRPVEGGQVFAGATRTVAAGLYALLRLFLPRDSFNQHLGNFDPAPNGPRNRPGTGISPSKVIALDLSEVGYDDEIQAGEVLTILHSVTPTQPYSKVGEISQARLKFQKAVLYLRRNEDLRQFVLAQPFNVHQRQDNLQALLPVHRLPIFHPSGHDMHFSPDGKRLAVSQLNGSVSIWAVDKFDGEPERTLPLSVGQFGWSPDSSRLVVIPKGGLSIWETNSLQTFSLETDRIRILAWLQSSSGFVAVINDQLRIYDTQLQSGNVHAPISDLPLRLHDVATIPQLHEEERKNSILVLGTLHDEDAPQKDSTWIPKTSAKMPKDACAERWLMVIELGTGTQQQSVAAAPVLADARYICVSSNGQLALISYGDGNPPELWQLRNQFGMTQLVFRGRFFTLDQPKTLDDQEGATVQGISGKARFCGESDKWVMATDGGSNIYIWDRATRILLRTLSGTQIETKFRHYSSINSITSTVRRDGSKGLIVVSACTEGGVIVWEGI